MSNIKNSSKNKEKVGHLVFGVHPIIELLKAKRRKIYSIYTTKPTPKSWDLIFPLLGKETQIQYVTRDVLDRIAESTDHQSIVAWAGPLVIRSKFFDKQKSPFLVMLDSIQDTRNLGAILRSVYCAGADGVVLCMKNSAPLNAIALKSSAGLAEHMEIYVAQSSQLAIKELLNAGYNIYFATLQGKDATQVTYEQPLCMVIGNEATGVNRQLLSSGIQVKLPQRTTDISYNASVAAGILLFIIGSQNKRI